ncbi:MAG: MBL fold metallo-hydrolase [Planctomycetota bacterium]
MRIHFFGAARTTTGSMHLIETDGGRLLLDCGLYQGKRKEAFERNRHLPFDPASVDACVLSHAHIDHSGNLPSLVKGGFRGPIVATPPTRDLCEIMLLDTAHLQEHDVEYVNKKRRKQGKNPFEPLYVASDVVAAMRRFHPLPYDAPREIVPGVQLTFRDAGHILGSALTVLDFSENGRSRRLLFTGDLGRRNMPILRDPVPVDNVHCLITESTYGNRFHPAHEDIEETLRELCRKVADARARLIIPAFSVGRTQQILYLLHDLWRSRRLPEVPVYVDSPLSVKATGLYDKHPECYDAESLDLIRANDDPFSFRAVTYVADVGESKKLNSMRGPLIIISASGMCEGGRILHHLKHGIQDRNNIILFVGYQAENTLGRRLVERQSPVRIFGEEFELRAEVRSVEALSAHADRSELLDFFRRCGSAMEKAFVVHGEVDQAGPFAQALRDSGIPDVLIPEPGQLAQF